MKKILFAKVFSLLCAAFLLAVTTVNATEALEDDGGGGSTTIKCPEGDTYKCYTQGSLTVYKGKGETVITPSN